MHENRETSETSAMQEKTDREVKAASRTTSAPVSEESDSVVIPVNQPNKEGRSGERPTAEAGEGRTGTKENVGLSHTPPTQGGKMRVSQGLAGVRHVASERKQEKFTAWLHHLTVDLLRDS